MARGFSMKIYNCLHQLKNIPLWIWLEINSDEVNFKDDWRKLIQKFVNNKHWKIFHLKKYMMEIGTGWKKNIDEKERKNIKRNFNSQISTFRCNKYCFVIFNPIKTWLNMCKLEFYNMWTMNVHCDILFSKFT